MPKAILTFDDTDDGNMKLDLFLEGGFQVGSNAHQAANLVLKYLDELGAVKEQGDVKTLTEDEAKRVIESAAQRQTVGAATPEDLTPIEQDREGPALHLVAP